MTARLTAAQMTDEQIVAEVQSLCARWDVLRAANSDGCGGSPGEWMFERLDELETEQKRRTALSPEREAAAADVKGGG